MVVFATLKSLSRHHHLSDARTKALVMSSNCIGSMFMSKFSTFTQLKELMFAMEQDLGISELSEPEKCVFSCIVQATEAGGSITTKAIEQHLLTSILS